MNRPATAEERTRARQTGVTVMQLRREEKNAESSSKNDTTAVMQQRREKKNAKKKRPMIKRHQHRETKEEKEKRVAKSLQALQAAKPKYKARGDINNCGDWLAKTLADNFLESEGKSRATFDIDEFTKCLRDNGIKIAGKWVQQHNRGWQGRFRMNGRQKLAVIIKNAGFLKINGEKLKPPRHTTPVDSDDE